MKKIVLYIVTMLMMLPCIVANAEGTEITKATISSIPVFEAGKKVGESKVEATCEGCIIETEWKKWSAVDEDYVLITDAEEVFNEQDIYLLLVKFTPQEGYDFSEAFTFEYADRIEAVSEWGELDENDRQSFWCAEFGTYTFRKEITDLIITTPDVTAGDIATLDDIIVEARTNDEIVPAEAVSMEAKWVETATFEEVTDTALEAEKHYQIEMTFTASDGYCFATDILVMTNGEEDFGFTAPLKIEVIENVSLFTPVDRFELTGLSNVKAGVALTDAIELKDDLGGTCEVSVEWYDEEENPVVEEEFVAGKTYLMNLNVYLTNGGTISENLVLVIDGEEYVPDTVYADEGQIFTMIRCEAAAGNENLIPMIVFGVIGVAILVDVVLIIRALKKRKKI